MTYNVYMYFGIVTCVDVRAPPVPVLRDILSSYERVTYLGLLMALAKSDRLNLEIGENVIANFV